MRAFLITLHLAGNPSQMVGVPIYGGASQSDCNAYARILIERVKLGAELTGRSYIPLGFKCEGRVG